MKAVKFKDVPIGSIFVTTKNFAYNNVIYEKDSDATARHLTWVFFQLRSTVMDFDATEEVFLVNTLYKNSIKDRIKSLQEEVDCLTYIVDKLDSIG